MGFPSSSVVKNLPAMQETRVRSLGWEDSLEEEMAVHSSILAWGIPWRSLVSYSPRGHRESDTTEWLTTHVHSRVFFSSQAGPLRYHSQDTVCIMGFPGGSAGKEPTCNARNPGSIPGSGGSPGGGRGSPLQHSCLGSPMDRGAWGLQSTGSHSVRHDSVTKPRPFPLWNTFIYVNIR